MMLHFVENLMILANSMVTNVVASPFLPFYCIVAFYLHEYSFAVFMLFIAFRVMNEYHIITSSFSTTLSKLFHLGITLLIGFNAWHYHLYDYICFFILIFLFILAMWILALSNLYPFNDAKSSRNQPTEFAHPPHLAGNLSSASIMNTSAMSTASDAFYDAHSPPKSKPRNSSFAYQARSHNASNLSTSSYWNDSMQPLPFDMNTDETLIFDDMDDRQLNNSLFGKNIVNTSILNFNKLSSTASTANADYLEVSRIRTLSEPSNFFQGLVGFSSVYSTLNFLNIFDEQTKSEIVNTMNKQNYFNLSSIHFASMVTDLFAFILIPFFMFHAFLLYQSQHSLIPVCYVLIVLFASQYGENTMDALVKSSSSNTGLFDGVVWKKNILSYSISSKYSLEGSIISTLSACVTSIVLYFCLGVVFYGPACAGLVGKAQCVDALCLVCESSFVSKMTLLNHIVLGLVIGIQSILGSLLMDIILKSHSYKLCEIYYTAQKDGNVFIWLQRFSSFTFAFAVAFYYLLL